MTKLYDLFLNTQFQMRAPLPVILQVLKFGDEAAKRIEHDTHDGKMCDLHKNGVKWFVRRCYELSDSIEFLPYTTSLKKEKVK
jgi:hypothetical protein